MSNLTEEEVKIFVILIFQRSFEHFLDVFSPVVSDLLLHQICLKNLLKERLSLYISKGDWLCVCACVL